jgi:hypothetical protein
MLSRSLIALPLSLLAALPAVAGISKSVSVEDALDGRVPIVVAAEGGGVNLDFSETGETVQKVTLDDTSKVLVDFDKSLPIVRLFRGNIASKDVPSAKTTQLSVTTKDADGDFHLYIFPVTTSSKPAIFTKFLIGGVTRRKGNNDSSTAALGVKIAEQNKTLVDPKLKGRVALYVKLRSGGMSDLKAAKRAQISRALAKRLDDLGQSAPSSVAQSPILSVPRIEIPKGQNAVRPAISLAPPPQSDAVLRPVDKPESPVRPLPKPVAKTATAPKTLDGQAYAGALLKGLNAARLSGRIRYGSGGWYRVNGSIRALKRGRSLDAAIRVSGLKRDRFMQLLEAGGLTP